MDEINPITKFVEMVMSGKLKVEDSVDITLRESMVRELFDKIASGLTKLETTDTSNLVGEEKEFYAKNLELYTDMYNIFQEADALFAEDYETEGDE